MGGSRQGKMRSYLHCRYQTESTREGGVGGWSPLNQAAAQPERGLGRRIVCPQDEESWVGGDQRRPSSLWLAAPRVTTWGQQRVRTVSKGGHLTRTQAMGKCSQPQPCSWPSKLVVITSAKVHAGLPLHLFSAWRASSHSPSLRSSSLRELAQVAPRLSRRHRPPGWSPGLPTRSASLLMEGPRQGWEAVAGASPAQGFQK